MDASAHLLQYYGGIFYLNCKTSSIIGIGVVSVSPQEIIEKILKSYVAGEDKRETIVLALKTLEEFPYAIVGGFAVSFYYKGARPVSPDDFDVKINPDSTVKMLEALKNKGFLLRRENLFMDSKWYVFERAGQGIDVGVAKKPWDVEGIKEANIVVFKGVRFKIFPPEYLLVSKLYAGRPKDMLDVAYLIKGRKVNIERTYQLIRKFLSSSDLEDFESVLMYAQSFDDVKLKQIFGVD